MEVGIEVGMLVEIEVESDIEAESFEVGTQAGMQVGIEVEVELSCCVWEESRMCEILLQGRVFLLGLFGQSSTSCDVPSVDS